jgi:chemotaxis signal transduction protein
MADGATRGWVMDVGGRWRLAVGPRCMVEYLLAPPFHALPRLPAHCLGVLVWQERLIPILDLGPVLSERPRTRERAAARAVVLAYQELPGQPLRYGALVVRSAPVEVWASDDMARPLPEHIVLKDLSRSCFAYREELIPVLDTKMLFTAALASGPAELAETADDECEPEAAPLKAAAERPQPGPEPEPVIEPEISIPAPIACLENSREGSPDETPGPPAVFAPEAETEIEAPVSAEEIRRRPSIRSGIATAALALAAAAAVLLALWAGFYRDARHSEIQTVPTSVAPHTD